MITQSAYLRMQDDVAALQSAFSRAMLGATVNTMRFLKGTQPVSIPRKGAHPHDVVGRRQGVTLLKYDAVGGEAKDEILIVASLINQWYVFDLLEDLSVIRFLQSQGFDVYVLDWGEPGAEGAHRTFSDYADGFIPWAIETIGNPVHVLGYCMGGTLSVIHAALHPEQVKSLTLLGAPVDFHQSGILSTWTQRAIFDADLLVDAFGNVPPLMLQSAFKTMAVSTTMKKYWDLWDKAEDDGSARHFLAVESWLEDNVAFPGGLYRPYIKDCYQENKLIQGTMEVGGRVVDLSRITMPVNNVVALRDAICAPAASKALMGKIGSAKGQVIEFDTGHIGLTTSKRALKELWPRIASSIV